MAMKIGVEHYNALKERGSTLLLLEQVANFDSIFSPQELTKLGITCDKETTEGQIDTFTLSNKKHTIILGGYPLRSDLQGKQFDQILISRMLPYTERDFIILTRLLKSTGEFYWVAG